jgi:hypothetical protein
MRLTSTGLGIGTSSPVSPLTVAGTSSVTWVGPGASTGTATIGTQGTGGSLLVQTPSVNASYASGFGVDGTYSGGKSVINLKALGTSSGGPYSADMAFFTTTNTTLSEKMRLDSSGNLGIGTSLPAYGVDVRGASGVGVQIYETSTGNNNRLIVTQAGTVSTYNNTYSTGSGTHAWQIGNSEQMRLTSTGLGIGTSSPLCKLDARGQSIFAVSGAPGYLLGSAEAVTVYGSGGSEVSIRTWQGGVASALIGHKASDSNLYITNTYAGNALGSNGLTLDSSGNLGLGVTPSAWQSGVRAFQNGAGALYTINTVQQRLSLNAYRDSAGTMRYINSSINANEFRMGEGDGSFQFLTAPSGTAGNAISFTQAMTLDASGRLMVNTTSASGTGVTIGAGGVMYVRSANDGSVGSLSVANDGTTNISAYNGTGGALAFVTANTSGSNTERARIDSSGNLLVGTTSAGGYRLRVEGGPTLVKYGDSSLWTSELWNPGTTGDNKFILFYTESSATTRGSITYNRGAGLVAYNTTSDYRAKDISGPVVDSGSLIDSTPVYMGKMKGATQERPMFIAHETPEYAHTGEKDAVDADGNPVYQQMDASALIPVMWAEIQSLRARLAAANI